MANLTKPQLRSRVIEAVKASGWFVLDEQAPNEHPFKLTVFPNGRSNESRKIKVYIWNVSHGGKKRADDEYRIQSKVSHFQPELGYDLLILGWWEEGRVFAAFDYRKHSGAVAWSASFQIKLDALENAAISGFSPSQKENQEIAIALRPDFLCHYVENRQAFHEFGRSSRDFQLLNTFSQQTESLDDDSLVDSMPRARRKAIRMVRTSIRDFNFRWRVLTAYTYKCAFCDIQLGLVEAAHIVPVSVENSTDATNNGIALCSLHHSAFDAGLVTLDERYRILVSENKISELRLQNLLGGEHLFRTSLRPVISVPPTHSDRPRIDNIKRANSLRGW
ncbi:MAG: HNH endonuclease [Candidatus Hydrogenedentes bacterium]|nr:HNH endonuclease [Candidatus Hydrogenedentota bacterium]